ncbi:MAG: hypothetical protein HFI68_11240 [Lachnospiraceae bacterium]|nr:hypothetical protein [Lachnospiraceae bacterium]
MEDEQAYLDFIHELERERDWRVAELNEMKRLFRPVAEMNVEAYVNIYLKMTVPMAYAHWEGYCVASFKILMEYMNKKEIAAQAVAYNILTYANNKTYDRLKGKSSFAQRVEFSKKFIEILNHNIYFSGRLDTKSNLNYKILQEILQIFGMDEEGVSEYESDLDTLVTVRNFIAHGENSRVPDFDKMNENVEIVTALIDAILLKQVRFAQEEMYLRYS